MSKIQKFWIWKFSSFSAGCRSHVTFSVAWKFSSWCLIQTASSSLPPSQSRRQRHKMTRMKTMESYQGMENEDLQPWATSFSKADEQGNTISLPRPFSSAIMETRHGRTKRESERMWSIFSFFTITSPVAWKSSSGARLKPSCSITKSNKRLHHLFNVISKSSSAWFKPSHNTPLPHYFRHSTWHNLWGNGTLWWQGARGWGRS